MRSEESCLFVLLTPPLLTPHFPILTPHFPQAQPADSTLMGIARLAGSGQVAVQFVAADVRAAIAKTREVFHVVTVTLTVPLQKPHSWVAGLAA